MTIEKRFHQRTEIDTEVHILHRERHIMATAQNITPYGMLLSTDKLIVPSGMLLEMSIEIDGRLSSVPGLVVWAGQQKIGIMFPQTEFALFTAAESIKGKYKSSVADSHRTSAKYMLFQPELHTSI